MRKYDKILFCTDFSETSDIAFEYAYDLAEQHKGELYIFHATSAPETPSGRERLDENFKKYLGRPIKTECITRQGPDSDEIIKYAKESNMDIIVLGTHGKSGFLKNVLIGSCAKQVVQTSPIPVLVVPAAEKANV